MLEKLEKIVVGIRRLCRIQTRLKTQSQSYNLPLPMKHYHTWLTVIPKHLRRELLQCYATNSCQTFYWSTYTNKASVHLLAFSHAENQEAFFPPFSLTASDPPPTLTAPIDALCCSVFILIHKHPLHKLANLGHAAVITALPDWKWLYNHYRFMKS